MAQAALHFAIYADRVNQHYPPIVFGSDLVLLSPALLGMVGQYLLFRRRVSAAYAVPVALMCAFIGLLIGMLFSVNCFGE
jgi:hypothetical protein